MSTYIVPKEDMNYLAQQSSGNLNMILSGMTALLHDNDTKVAMLENQTWFQRMCRTVSGKNKMTQQEIQRNHDKINAYMTQAMTELYEQQCIDRQIMMSLGNQLNELYAEHLQLKQMLGAFVSKLNEKIESIDSFHMLNTEIEQGIYSNFAPIASVCYVLSQMDRRCIEDYRKMNILQRSMATAGILNNAQHTLSDYLVSIAEIPVENIGSLYIELSSLRENFMANIILNMIENYHFAPDMTRRMKNKQALAEKIIANEQLDPSASLSIDEVYQSFVRSKLEMFENMISISEIQLGEKLKEAEKLYLNCKLDNAFEIFLSLAENGNGRAMYYVGEYYCWGYGKIEKDEDKADSWRTKGNEAEDVLAALNYSYSFKRTNEEQENLFKAVLDLAENGDAVAQNELAEMYSRGYGCTQNEEQQLHWLKISANNGYWHAMNELGNIYRTSKDYEEALEWYYKASEKGYAEAQKNLGLAYYNGKGVEKDYTKSLRWWKKAAEQGNATAMQWLAELYRDGEGTQPNQDEALIWFKKAAERGNGTAANSCGLLYDKKNDTANAAKYYLYAAELGNEWGMYNLGICYNNGSGVIKNENQALQWFKRAGEKGVLNAQKKLGSKYYEKGDYLESSKWWEMAVEQGDKKAITEVVDCQRNLMYTSNGNFNKLAEWLIKAVEAGYTDCGYEFELGGMYRFGACSCSHSRGTEGQDIEKAIYWYQKGVEHGDILCEGEAEALREEYDL